MPISASAPWFTARSCRGSIRRCLACSGACWSATAAKWRARRASCATPDRRFDPHTHGGGEEFLVLEGVFSDEHADFGPGMYVRNPPGSRHTPQSGPGCTILVKLRQMDPEDQEYVRIDTTSAPWQPGPVEGAAVMPLFERRREKVALWRLAPGTRLPPPRASRG